MSQSSEESSFLGKVIAAITRWLGSARSAVFSAGRRFPDPSAVMSTQPVWDSEVDGLLGDLEQVNAAAWEDASGRPFISANAFTVTQLALTENLLKRIPEETYQRIFAELVEGQQAGESVDQIAARIDRVLLFDGSEWWPNRARTIAQTEVHRAWQNGTLAAALYYEPPTGPGWTKTWHTEMDGRERASHKRANGQRRKLADKFQVGGRDLMYPGDPTAPADEVINCVTADTSVLAGTIRAAYRYWNDDPLVKVVTAKGLILTVSSYHPILTVKGWVPACQLNEGDDLVCAGGADLLAGGEPDVKTYPATAGEVFDALALANAGHRVSGLHVDFHGDTVNGDVDVVFANGLLPFSNEAVIDQKMDELLFTCADAPDASLGSLFKFGQRSRDSTNGVMSFGDLVSTLLGVHPTPLEGFSLAAGSGSDSLVTQAAVDGDAVNAEMDAQFVDGAAFAVSLDKVVDVQRDVSHDGFLYTFETRSGAYLSNGIVSHNCRCDMVIEGM